ncbi:MAG: choice-of-anchor J domain-containing protein [Sedimentisphaerales bacterium]|nr:choice-of-anchor J domain-containing protein [Sedimentisphaerales bacterium]
MIGRPYKALLVIITAVVWVGGLAVGSAYGQSGTLSIGQNADSANNVRLYQLITDQNFSDPQASGNNNGAVNRGETISFLLTLRNNSGVEIRGLTARISASSEFAGYVQILQDTALLDTIRPGREATTSVSQAYRLRVLPNLPADRDSVSLLLSCQTENGLNIQIPLTIIVEPQAPIEVGEVRVVDRGHPSCNDNGVAEAGETILIQVPVRNLGSSDVIGLANRNMQARLSFSPAAGGAGVISLSVAVVRCPTLHSQGAATILEFAGTIGRINTREELSGQLTLDNAVYNGYPCNFVHSFSFTVSAGPPRISTVFRLGRDGSYAAVEATQISSRAHVLVEGEPVDSVFSGSLLIFPLPDDVEGQLRVQVVSAEGLASQVASIDFNNPGVSEDAGRITSVYRAIEDSQELVVFGQHIGSETTAFINGRPVDSRYQWGALVCRMGDNDGSTEMSLFVRNPQSPISLEEVFVPDELPARSRRGLLENDFAVSLEPWHPASNTQTIWHIDDSFDATGTSAAAVCNPTSNRCQPDTDATLTSPVFSLDEMAYPQLSFSVVRPGATAPCPPGEFHVEASTDNGRSWQRLYSNSDDISSTWSEKVVDLSGLGDVMAQVRFRFTSGSTSDSEPLYIDDVRIASAGPEITDIYIVSHSPYRIGVAGTNFDENSTVYLDGQAVASRYQRDELTFQLPRGGAQPTYNLVVRNADDVESAVTPLDVTQLTTRIAFLSDFDFGMGDWQVEAANSTRWHHQAADGSTSGCMRASIPNGTQYGNNAYTTLTSPAYNLSQIPHGRLSFIHCIGGDAAGDHLSVEIATTSAPTWRTLYTSDARLGTAWVPIEIDLSEYQDQQFQIRFAFRSNESGAGPGMFVDDVRIDSAPPRCLSLCCVDADGQFVLTGRHLESGTMVLINGYPVPGEVDQNQIRFRLPGSAARDSFRLRLRNGNGLMSPEWNINTSQVRAADEQGLLYESFDFGLGDWQVIAGNTTVWHYEAGNAASGTGCARASVPQANSYTNRADTVLISPTLDLTSLSSVRLAFQLRMLSETNDRIFVDISTSSNRQWQTIYRSGPPEEFSQWRQIVLDLSQFRRDQAQIRFRFVSDELNTGTAVFIDEVLVSSYPPSITDVFRLAAAPDKIAVQGEHFDVDAVVQVNDRPVPTRLMGDVLIFRSGDAPADEPFVIIVRNADGMGSAELEIATQQLPIRSAGENR